jgi:hypothetical protein|tara:strand:- start:239 stop:724 length:486 start_codon:yes stop_codon:yes gene_type:complete
MAKRSKTESAKSKVETATALAGLGGAIGSVFTPVGGAIGAGIGGLTGLIIGDKTTVFPVDMIAVPAFEWKGGGLQDYSFKVYIKAGETLVPTGGNVLDMQENMNVEKALDVQANTSPAKRKRSKWNIYTSKKKNQIRFKSGKKKGLLNLKAMGREYRRGNK